MAQDTADIDAVDCFDDTYTALLSAALFLQYAHEHFPRELESLRFSVEDEYEDIRADVDFHQVMRNIDDALRRGEPLYNRHKG